VRLRCSLAEALKMASLQPVCLEANRTAAPADHSARIAAPDGREGVKSQA